MEEKKAKREKDGINKRFERMIRNSFIARFLLFLGVLEEGLSKSRFKKNADRAADGKKGKKNYLRKIKLTIAKEIEQSLIFHGINRFFDLLLRLPVRAYGTLLFASSFGCSIVSAIKNNIAGESLVTFRIILPFAVCALLSLILLAEPKEKSLGRAVIDSRILSYLLFDLLGLRKRSFETKKTAEVHYLTVLLLALVSALLTIFIDIQTLIAAVLWILFARMAFHSPEAGFMSILLFFPVLPDTQMMWMMILVLTGYMFKIFRSQRTFRPGFYGLIMGAYAFLVLFGTLMTPQSGSGLSFGVCFTALCGFFLAHLSMGQREWICRAASVIAFAGVGAAIWVAALFGAWYLPEQYKAIFPFIVQYKRPIGFAGLESAGIFIGAAVAILSARNLKTKNAWQRICAILGGIFLAAGAIVSQASAAWFALIAALFVLLIINKNFAVVPTGILTATVAVVYSAVLPTFITVYISNFSTGFSAVPAIIGERFAASFERAFTGIGEAGVVKGENFYSHILTAQGAVGVIFFAVALLGIFGFLYYACVHNENVSRQIKQILYGFASAASALLVAGIFTDLWRDPKLPFVLFTLLGLMLAGGRMLLRESEQQMRISDIDRDYIFIPVIKKPSKTGRKKKFSVKNSKKAKDKYETADSGSTEKKPIALLPEEEKETIVQKKRSEEAEVTEGGATDE